MDDNNNNNHINFLIQNAKFRLRYLCKSIDGMYLRWENIFKIYTDMLQKKFHSMSQERQIVIYRVRQNYI